MHHAEPHHRPTRRRIGGMALSVFTALLLVASTLFATGAGAAGLTPSSLAVSASAKTIAAGSSTVLRYDLTSGGLPVRDAMTEVDYLGRKTPVRVDGNGHGALLLSGLPIGVSGVAVRYAGDATHGHAVNSIAITVTGNSALAVSASAKTITAGSSTVLRYDLTSGGLPVPNAMTEVDYLGRKTPVRVDGNGHGALLLSGLPIGVSGVAVRYAGDAYRGSAVGAIAITVSGPSSLALSTSASSVTSGGSMIVRYDLTADGRPISRATTTVSYSGKTVSVGVDGNGHGALALSAASLGAGQRTITVSYAGDATHGPVTASISVTVAATADCPAWARACIDLTHSVSWLQSNGKIVYGPVQISSGRPGYRTPAGSFRVYWKDKDHRSSIFGGAPMPNSVFFVGGVAFHAGSPYVTSHGCIHLTYGDSVAYWNFLGYGDGVHVFGYAPY